MKSINLDSLKDILIQEAIETKALIVEEQKLFKEVTNPEAKKANLKKIWLNHGKLQLCRTIDEKYSLDLPQNLF